MNNERLHYTASGLLNVWLVNGFEWKDGRHGRTLKIHDLHGLHDAIGAWIVEHSPALTGPEFRFLRKELDFSQNTVGKIVGQTEQSIALWEKKVDKPVPKSADLVLRSVYKSTKEGKMNFRELVDRINDLDRQIISRELTMTDQEGHWRVACG
jgi:DNA-binding transcriptional regulator YiaG